MPDDDLDAFDAFATGGLPGLLDATDSDPWDESGDPNVEDPEALRRAEEAAAGSGLAPGRGRGTRSQEEWVPIARETGESLFGGLQAVAAALQSEDVPFGWDPYDPRDMPSFLPPMLGTPARSFAVLVPASAVRSAREAIGDLAPEGVDYPWSKKPDDLSDGNPADHDASATVDAAPVTAYGRMSDNERLQRMASGRSSGCAATVLCVGAGLVFACYGAAALP